MYKKSPGKTINDKKKLFQRHISNENIDKGILLLEGFSEGSFTNTSLPKHLENMRRDGVKRQGEGHRAGRCRSPMGNIFFPDRLISDIKPIIGINYRRDYKNVRSTSVHSEEHTKAQLKKNLRIQETNLTFFNGSLKQSSVISEPLDLDLTNLENFYERGGRPTASKGQKHKRESQREQPRRKGEAVNTKDSEKDKNFNSNSIILSGRYIDCGFSTSYKRMRSFNKKKQNSNGNDL